MVFKPETPTEDLEVVSQPGSMSSAICKRFFYEYLPEGKGTKSNILATAEDLVVVQSLASLREDIEITLLEEEYWSLELFTHSLEPISDQPLKH